MQTIAGDSIVVLHGGFNRTIRKRIDKLRRFAMDGVESGNGKFDTMTPFGRNELPGRHTVFLLIPLGQEVFGKAWNGLTTVIGSKGVVGGANVISLVSPPSMIGVGPQGYGDAHLDLEGEGVHINWFAITANGQAIINKKGAIKCTVQQGF